MEYADPPEDVVVLSDGSPYRGEMHRLAVSRDGRFVAFPAQGGPFGLGDDFNGIVVYDRERDAVHGTCVGNRRGGPVDWDLSEEGRFVMRGTRRCDLVTGEVVDVDVDVGSYSHPDEHAAFFRDGSGVAYYDHAISAIRTIYYDGRPDVVVPLDLEPVERGHAYVASDRWGRHLFVSGLYTYPPVVLQPGTHWLVSLPDGAVRRLEVGARNIQLMLEFNQEIRPGMFSDDGETLHVVLEGVGGAEFDVEALDEAPSRSSRYARISEPFDDERFVTLTRPEGRASEFWIFESIGYLTVRDGEDDSLVRADLSAYRHPLHFLDPAIIVTAPESHEVFVSIPLYEGGHALVVVPVPPREAP